VDLASAYAFLVPDADREDKPIVVPAMETLAKAGVEAFVPFGGAVVVIWEALRGHFANRVGRTVEEVLAEVPADALASKMAESSEFEALVALALESAGRTGYEPKRSLLGRVIVNAAADDAQIDPSSVVAHVLRDIDAPHIRALERVRLAQDTMTFTPDEQSQVDREPEAERSVRWQAVRRAGGKRPVANRKRSAPCWCGQGSRRRAAWLSAATSLLLTM
jgi:hypothetical protein